MGYLVKYTLNGNAASITIPGEYTKTLYGRCALEVQLIAQNGSIADRAERVFFVKKLKLAE
jgi:hypothetical protein